MPVRGIDKYHLNADLDFNFYSALNLKSAMEILNVKGFGAKGDGVTDDTEAIQNAIDTVAAAGGGIVWLPEGHYKISGTLHPDSYVIIAGEGAKTIIEAALDVDGFAMFAVMEKESVVIRDLVLDGKVNEKTQTAASSCIHLNYSNNCLIENVIMKNFGLPAPSSGGAYLVVLADEGYPSAYNNVIRNCKFLDDGRSNFGIRLYTDWTHDIESDKYTSFCRNNVVEGCYFEGFAWNGIEVAGPATVENVIAFNTHRDHLGYASVEADKGASRNVFIGNILNGLTITGATGGVNAFRDQGVSGDGYPTRYATDNIWVGNIAENITPSQEGATSNVSGFVASLSRNCTIIGLNVRNVNPVSGFANKAGIWLANCSDTVISGGVLSEVDIGVVVETNVERAEISNLNIRAESYAYRSLFGTPSNVSISGCRITGGGIRGSNEAILSVINNTVSDVSNEGILTGTETASCLIADNIVKDCGSGIFVANPDGGAVVRDNLLINCAIVNNYEDARHSVFGNVSTSTADSRARVITVADEPPTGGTWYAGDIVINRIPGSGSPIGWVCVSGGTPGTWVPLAVTELSKAAAQADSTATDVAGLRADFNALLQKLRDAKLMA